MYIIIFVVAPELNEPARARKRADRPGFLARLLNESSWAGSISTPTYKMHLGLQDQPLKMGRFVSAFLWRAFSRTWL
jgi:hypothetical protein